MASACHTLLEYEVLVKKIEVELGFPTYLHVM